MAISALLLIEAVRDQLDDQGGDTGAPSAGYYARWQEDDTGCLWKNTDLVRYLNQTLRELGQRQPIKDGGTRYPVVLQAGQRHYELPAEVVRIESAVRTSDGEPLVKTTLGEMQAITCWNRLQRDTLGVDWRTEIGLPTHYLLDEQQGFLTVYPTPAEGYLDTLRLTVWRTYRSELDWANLAHESLVGAPLLTASGWTVGSGWTELPTGVFTHSSGTATLTHAATIVSGTTYRLTYTISERTAGSLAVTCGGQTLTGLTVAGETEFPAVSSGGLTVTPTTDFDGVVELSLVATASLTLIDDVPDHYFDALLAGICARAYRKRDADTYAPKLVAEFEAEFDRRVGPPRSFLNLDADARWADMPGDITPRTYFAR